uniref:PDZ domain-containing protein n=1 Tax=Anopheles albimanus TaxID=7167 RepID=A0A8W7K9K2_ANOAL
MVLDLSFSRYDNTTPFGFKLVGGADFDVPLTVVKILPGSIAEALGMQMGDVVVRINEIPTGNMSYYDAHQLLACAGNQFVLGILRAREVSSSQRLIKEKTPSGEVEYINTSPKPFWTPNVTSPAPLCQLQTQEEREIDEKIPDAPITDEQIAEILSGEAEVLKQHNIIGVNFKKMIPASGVFKQSEVFKTLNSELVQSEEEDKKWTTFLQKPQRPAPKTPDQRKLECNPPTERYQDSDSSSQHQTSGDLRTAVQDELKLQVVKKKKKATSAFGPLTPQERPIFLPGGRKWRTAKDAFNEQFIAEVISSQAELIQGTTLGTSYESPHLGYDDRVNFLKYQKPEKDLSFIRNSDVYKLVHDMDPPKSGIELRPEMVVAEEDVRKVMKDETIFQPRESKVFLYQN